MVNATPLLGTKSLSGLSRRTKKARHRRAFSYPPSGARKAAAPPWPCNGWVPDAWCGWRFPAPVDASPPGAARPHPGWGQCRETPTSRTRCGSATERPACRPRSAKRGGRLPGRPSRALPRGRPDRTLIPRRCRQFPRRWRRFPRPLTPIWAGPGIARLARTQSIAYANAVRFWRGTK